MFWLYLNVDAWRCSHTLWPDKTCKFIYYLLLITITLICSDISLTTEPLWPFFIIASCCFWLVVWIVGIFTCLAPQLRENTLAGARQIAQIRKAFLLISRVPTVPVGTIWAHKVSMYLCFTKVPTYRMNDQVLGLVKKIDREESRVASKSIYDRSWLYHTRMNV